MNWTTLISADELAEAIDRCTVIDTRHDLLDPAVGPAAYGAGLVTQTPDTAWRHAAFPYITAWV